VLLKHRGQNFKWHWSRAFGGAYLLSALWQQLHLYPFGEPILRIGEKMAILKTFLASSSAGEGRRPCGGGSLECG